MLQVLLFYQIMSTELFLRQLKGYRNDSKVYFRNCISVKQQLYISIIHPRNHTSQLSNPVSDNYDL